MGCFVIKNASLKSEPLEDMMKFDLDFVFDFKFLVFYK